MAGTMDAMRKGGIETFYGKWLVEGAPRVLLMDVKAAADKFFDEWKGEFKEKTGVELPSDDDMAEDALVFGYLAAWFFREVRANPATTRRKH